MISPGILASHLSLLLSRGLTAPLSRSFDPSTTLLSSIRFASFFSSYFFFYRLIFNVFSSVYSHLPLTFPNFHISSHVPRHRCFVGKNILFLAPTALREFLFLSCFLTFIRPLRYEGERTPPQSTHICSFSLALLDSATPSRTFPNIHHPPLRVAPLPGPFLSSVAPFSRPIVFSLSSTTSPHRNS